MPIEIGPDKLPVTNGRNGDEPTPAADEADGSPDLVELQIPE